MKAASSSFVFFSEEYKQEKLFFRKLTSMWCLAHVLPTYLSQLYLAYFTAQNNAWKNYASI